LDRGPDGKKLMDLVMRLEIEAKNVGDKVVMLLGNQ